MVLWDNMVEFEPNSKLAQLEFWYDSNSILNKLNQNQDGISILRLNSSQLKTHSNLAQIKFWLKPNSVPLKFDRLYFYHALVAS